MTAVQLLAHGDEPYIREKLRNGLNRITGALYEGVRHSQQPLAVQFPQHLLPRRGRCLTPSLLPISALNIPIAVTKPFFCASSPGCMDVGARGVPYFPRWRNPHHLPSSRDCRRRRCSSRAQPSLPALC